MMGPPSVAKQPRRRLEAGPQREVIVAVCVFSWLEILAGSEARSAEDGRIGRSRTAWTFTPQKEMSLATRQPATALFAPVVPPRVFDPCESRRRTDRPGAH
jgi:hypothetical protein